MVFQGQGEIQIGAGDRPAGATGLAGGEVGLQVAFGVRRTEIVTGVCVPGRAVVEAAIRIQPGDQEIGGLVDGAKALGGYRWTPSGLYKIIQNKTLF